MLASKSVSVVSVDKYATLSNLRNKKICDIKHRNHDDDRDECHPGLNGHIWYNEHFSGPRYSAALNHKEPHHSEIAKYGKPRHNTTHAVLIRQHTTKKNAVQRTIPLCATFGLGYVPMIFVLVL